MNPLKLFKNSSGYDLPFWGMRAGIAGFLLAGSFLLMGSATAAVGDSLSVVSLGMLAMSCLVGAVLMMLPETVPFATRPLTGLIDRIYFGDSWREPPPVDLKLAHAYRHEGRLEDALGEYTRARESHPGNVEVLAEGILTLRALGEEKTAARWLRKGLRRVHTDEERAKLNGAMTAPAVALVDRFY